MTYDGTQLASHWIYKKCGILGDVIVAFQGPCRVDLEDMVDLADVRDGACIYSPWMLHFLVEHFDTNLQTAVLRQRLLILLAYDILHQKTAQKSDSLKRKGDDLYCEGRKLSVSIATASPVSTLIHFGVNINAEGAPVPAIGLNEMNVDPIEFARDLMDAYVDEIESIRDACLKVRWVP